jgi:hypothetical protein
MNQYKPHYHKTHGKETKAILDNSIKINTPDWQLQFDSSIQKSKKSKTNRIQKAHGISKRTNQVPYHTKANTKRIQKRPY